MLNQAAITTSSCMFLSWKIDHCINFTHVGSCNGDSGGPLMVKDLKTFKWIQIATVHGSFGPCGDTNVPGLWYQWKHILVLG